MEGRHHVGNWQLALHVATRPGTIAWLSRQSPMLVPDFSQASAASAADLLPTLEQSLATARQILAGWTTLSLATCGAW